MGSVGLVHQYFHSMGMGHADDASQIGADAVVSGIIYQYGPGVRMVLHGSLHLGHLHPQSNSQFCVHIRIHIDGNGAV